MGSYQLTPSETPEKTKRSGGLKIAAALLGAVLIVEIALAIWLPLRTGTNCPSSACTGSIRMSEYSGSYKSAAVSSDASVCSALGKQVMAQGGNAVDGIIATNLCIGVHNMNSCGIGGGSFLVIYDPVEKRSKFINCRETAPRSASKNMFVNSIENAAYGARAIGVPGEIKCLTEAHDKYGKMEWSQLVDPIVDLVRNGVYVTSASESHFATSTSKLIGDNSSFHVNGIPLGKGDKFVNENLAKVLEIISEDKYAFYKEPLAQAIVDDINDEGGSFDLEDLTGYQIDEIDALKFEFLDYVGYVGAPPSSGVILSFILNIMASLKERGQLPAEQNSEFYHKLTEAYKFAYGKRSRLGDRLYAEDKELFDELVSNLTSSTFAQSVADKIMYNTLDFDDYEPDFEIVEDSGTSHMNVVDKDGMVCAMTSTINTGLGSKVVGKRTGIIFNNEMDDFSTPGHNNYFGAPPSPANFIQPGKRPLSSMAPVIITDKQGNFVLAMGGAGGTRITTQVAAVITKVLMQGMDLNEALQSTRIHHQLMPNEIIYEPRLTGDIRDDLMSRGHNLTAAGVIAITNGIHMKNGRLEAVADSRKIGRPDGY